MSDTMTQQQTPDAAPAARSGPTRTSFAGLVGVELRRIWWRRLTKLAVFGVLALTLLALFNVYNQSRPESLALRLDEYKQVQIDAERQRAEIPSMIADCEKQQAQERANGNPEADHHCAEMAQHMGRAPSMQDMGLALPLADTLTAGLAETVAYAYAFIVLILMASVVSAEFSTGSMGSWLTFRPRRLQVALSKLAAVALGGALVAGAGLVLVNLGARMIATINRPGSTLKLPAPPPLEYSIAEVLLRAIALSVMTALVGAALGLVLRHTAAVVGVLLGYLVAFEGMAVNSFMSGRLTPWAIVPNATAFLTGQHEYHAETCVPKGPDISCTYEQHVISYTHGWVYLVSLTIALVVIGVLAFRRRDVT